ncbi:MAG: DNA polymerase III subunit gamma/tau [Acidimicrobiales bacterium]
MVGADSAQDSGATVKPHATKSSIAAEASAQDGAQAAEAYQYQALYRRFRPQRFCELAGQQHAALALSNAVSTSKVAHAYLFSGPRGTGKTSCARILAKALNCTNRIGGEPCDTCASCVAIRDGSSLDVYELDAASNSGVDAIRELISKTSLATPGRWKIYIIDEIHMLSTAASNALLKTLEEPPAHVVFVLATTDPQKVISTIRSRTQHYEFRLLGPEELTNLLADVSDRAQLPLPQGALTAAMRRARGSARDALSSLEQISILGRVDEEDGFVQDICLALADRDTAKVLTEVARAGSAGVDPARLALELVDYLRQGFLGSLAPQLPSLDGSDLARSIEVTSRMGLASLVRVIELLGHAMVDMRDSLDPRTQLEAALLRLCSPEADNSNGALLERIEKLERAVAARAIGNESADTTPSAKRQSESVFTSQASPSTKPALGAFRMPGETPVQPVPQGTRADDDRAGATPVQPVPQGTGDAGTVGTAGTPQGTATTLSKEAVVMAWGDTIVNNISRKAKGRYVLGRFTCVNDSTVTFALPNAPHMRACAELRDEVEAAISRHFDRQVTLELVVDDEQDDANQDGKVAAGRMDGGNEIPIGVLNGEGETAGGDFPSVADATDSFGSENDPMNVTLPLPQLEPRKADRRPPEEHIREFFPGVEEV